DRGASWSAGDATADVLSLAVDRRTRPETVYAGTAAGDVRRSADRGTTWSSGGSGLDGQPVAALAVDPRRHRGVVWAGTMAAIFRSTDGGASWRKRGALAVRKIVVDPTRPRTVVAVREGVF